MSSGETRADDWLSGLRLASERLLTARGLGEQRPGQARLLILLLAAPFVLSAMIAQAAITIAGPIVGLAAVCATFAISWLLALLMIERVPTTAISVLTLVIGPTIVGGSVGLLGGIASPIACMLLALPLECYRVGRSARWAAIALGTGVAAMAAGAFVVNAVDAPSVWHWLTPALYAATLALRRRESDARTATARSDAADTLDASLLDAAVFRLSCSGEVESVGGVGQAMFNVDSALLLGTGLFDRVHVGDRVAFLCAIADARQSGRSAKVEVKIRRAVDPETGNQGGYGLFEIEMLRDATGGGAWAVVRDAASLADLRTDLARAVEEANAVEVAKGRFLSTVSHELRTPLNAIIGFSEMLLHKEMSGDLTSKQAEHVALIREAGNHLLSVVNAVLDVSKIESGSYHLTIEPFDLRPAVELCCAMLEPQASAKGISLSAKMPGRLDWVLGDQRAVQQILLNLVSNAIKFTPEGGSVSVNGVAKDGVVRLFVNDTGIGIGAEDLATLGRPFMQVRNDYTRQFQGTGLGLSLVKGLVRLHDGTMSIESAPGLGTTVTIGLPSADVRAGDGSAKWNAQGEENGTALRRIA